MKVLQSALAFLLFALLSSFVSSCGLEDAPYIVPPIAGSAQEETYFTFTHALGNEWDSFYGYWVLYRIYQTEEAAVAAREAINANPAMTTDAGYRILTDQYKYRPMLKAASIEGPGVFNFKTAGETAFGTSFRIEINFSPLSLPEGEAYLFSDGRMDVYNIYRNNNDERDSFRSIELSPSDPDVQALRPGELANDEYYWVDAWAFASAINLTTFQQLYSTGAYLGCISIRK